MIIAGMKKTTHIHCRESEDNNTGIRKFTAAALILLACGFAAARPAYSCDIPVFRYALERWPAEPYDALALHRGPLTEAERARLGELQTQLDATRPPANVRIQTADILEPMTEDASDLLKGLDPEQLPAVVLRYPDAGGGGQVIWSGSLMSEAARNLVDSPARKKIAERLIAGDAAAWVLVESGNREADEAAAGRLMEKLNTVSLLIARVSRTDPAESIFAAMLLNSEPDLDKYADQPMAFPVFGRGRALYALVGRGILDDNIEGALQFLTGPCVCQIKEQNPGADLLMAANWDEVSLEPLPSEDQMPPLTGVFPWAPDAENVAANVGLETAGIASIAQVPSEGGDAPAAASRSEGDAGGLPAAREQTAGVAAEEKPKRDTGLVRTAVGALIGMAVLVGVATIIMTRRAGRKC